MGRFSTLQSAVALIAGLTSIVGAGYSAVDALRATPAPGEIVATVRAAGTSRPLPGAVVEIATRDDALVTTMLAADDGLARSAVAPGAYRLRTRHPAFADVVREVQVVSEHTAELHLVLEPRPRPNRAASAPRPPSARTAESSVDAAVRAIDRGATRGRRWLGRLGL